MARLNPNSLTIAQEIIARYPITRSALIPLLHLAQEQDGYVTEDAMAHIAELVGVTPAEVMGTCSFYEMLKRSRWATTWSTSATASPSPAGLVGVDSSPETTLGVKPGGTTDDGKITLEAVECIAACTEAPCLQVNYRYRNQVSTEGSTR